jgi:hypothetical protein
LVALACSLLIGAGAVHHPIAVRADGPLPHHMTNADGSLNMETCGACHTPDMGLQGSRLETCTLCHLETTHSGTVEHLRAQPDQVTRAMAARAKDAVPMPLTEDGKIWCGTCHLYHDPKVLSENWLAQGWIPPDQGLPATVRESVLARWSRLAQAYDQTGTVGSFAEQGTRQLRLPAKDGTICRQCHAEYGGSEK